MPWVVVAHPSVSFCFVLALFMTTSTTASSPSAPTSLCFYYDPISPFAWLAFARLPEVLMGISHHVVYKPVLFAAMLKQHGQLGPAEIASKRDWTYRQVLWLGQHLGVPLRLPASHPFNPLPVLRLALATAVESAPEMGATNRLVTETVLRHVWAQGGDPLEPARLKVLHEQLAEHMHQRGRTLADPNSDAVRQQLRANTAQALAAGAFGVPTMVVNDRLFWGLDSLPMVRASLLGDPWFSGADWDSPACTPVGIVRSA
jgi:2-hydroxychromene-2-carboxylate isomerase